MLKSGIVDEVFMNNKRPQNSIDGFALRRRTPQPGGTQFNGRRAEEDMRVPDRFLHDGNLPRYMNRLSRVDLSEKLRRFELW